jgi:hypothetical protein
MMKTVTFFIFIFLFAFGIQAQTTKILFDATKAEAAGNADWVIDADQYNLGFQYGPAVIGQGDESNAQRYQTPVQSGITQTTQETYWNGALSAWGIDLVKKGYAVETLPYNGQITFGNTSNVQDLSHYKVFIVCEPNIAFTSSEKTAILHFVQNGGGLFMISDHDNSDRNNDGMDSPHIWNDLLTNNAVATDPFGLSFDYASFSQTTTNIPNLPSDPLLHGVMGNVTEAMWSSGTSMTLNKNHNPSVLGVVYKNGSSYGNTNVMVAYGTYESGRFVGFGDSSPCDDGSGDPNDQLYDGWIQDANGNHEKIIINATIWLASSPVAGIREEVQNRLSVRFFPNPFQDKGILSIGQEIKLEDSSLEIFDLTGTKVISVDQITSRHTLLDLQSLSQGIYYYRFIEHFNVIGTGKIVKNQE